MKWKKGKKNYVFCIISNTTFKWYKEMQYPIIVAKKMHEMSASTSQCIFWTNVLHYVWYLACKICSSTRYFIMNSLHTIRSQTSRTYSSVIGVSTFVLWYFKGLTSLLSHSFPRKRKENEHSTWNPTLR